MLSSTAVFMVGFLSALMAAASIGEKRTILTSGDKVQTVRYQLGQSTVLYFGMKPETVICGNKNYFHIDKIKEGITIQATSNLSTNLTVLSQGKRFLFYLTPASGGKPDSFIDVRWVPTAETKQVANSSGKQEVRELRGILRAGPLELKLLRGIVIAASKRSILEFEIKNSGKELKTSAIEILALKGKRALPHQVAVFEAEALKPGATTKGRLIVTDESLSGLSLLIKYQGNSANLQGIGY